MRAWGTAVSTAAQARAHTNTRTTAHPSRDTRTSRATSRRLAASHTLPTLCRTKSPTTTTCEAMRTIALWEARGPRDNSRRLPNRTNAQHAGSYIHVGKQGPADRKGNTSPPNLTVAVEWYAGTGDCCLNSSAAASSRTSAPQHHPSVTRYPDQPCHASLHPHT